MPSLYNAENPIFANFCFYSAILVVKTLIMALMTARLRFAKRAFANPEDTKLIINGKLKFDDDVERVRRAHLNDLENIFPFLILGLIYVGTSPNIAWAKLLFRIFTGARLVHTFVYAIVVIPQPARILSFMIGFAVNFLMAHSIIYTYFSAL